MNVKLFLAASALAVVAGGWFAGAGATAGYGQDRSTSARAAAATARPELDVFSAQSTRLGVKAPTYLTLEVPAGAAEAGKVTLYVPDRYGLNPADPPGTREGDDFIDAGSDFGLGDLRAADPAYIDPGQAQACAPGSHDAVWTLQFDLSSTSLTVPVYIDRTSGEEAALGAYKLQICLPLAHVASQAGGWPLGSRVKALGLSFTRITNPGSAGVYVWRAFVSNPDATGNPDASTTYELRSDMPLPAKLSLAGRFDRAHHRAIFSGRLTTPSLPAGGLRISLYRRVGVFWRNVGSTRTSASGSYKFVRRQSKTTTYGTEVWAIGTCNGTSTAPRGCATETHGAIDSPNVRVVVRHR
jgi:hypothetical protein